MLQFSAPHGDNSIAHAVFFPALSLPVNNAGVHDLSTDHLRISIPSVRCSFKQRLPASGLYLSNTEREGGQVLLAAVTY